MSTKKKLLMLGGADIQVSAIKKAKEMECYVITCDYLPNNPGHPFADEYHNVSTTDKEKVLELAQRLSIDGILAYASDPAAPTAAFVAEKLGLPTNPYAVVEIMSRKDLFRQFMQENGFLMPRAKAVTTYKEALEFHTSIGKDTIIKPVDSSGSKGIYKIEKTNQSFEAGFQAAISFSKAGIVIIEEFIYKKGYQIGGDGFLVNGELVFRCFGDIHFSQTNPLLPCSVSIPTLHEPHIVEKVHQEVQKLLSCVGMKMGALNFDILVDNEDNVYILEIGPRNGGNMIPELTAFSTGVDMKEYSIKTALGEDCTDLRLGEERRFFSHYVVHASKSGAVKSFTKSEILNKHLLYEHYNFKPGDRISSFSSSANRLGVLLLQYTNEEEMIELIYNMNKYLTIEIKE
ncbi:MAG: ATP-grasp domain-containing protein [Saprospiraceae bacterium]|nr:ATP-grasp domain-containing protein [Saprospiraceae bacterium]